MSNKILNTKTKNYIDDLTGQKFGRLTVIKFDQERFDADYDSGNRHYQQYWICECSCGNIISVLKSQLINGKTKSCGCYKGEKSKERFKEDLTGKVYGKLTVIGRDYKREEIRKEQGKKAKQYWLCKCSCGNEDIISVEKYKLNSGHTQSCGCYKDEIRSKTHSKDMSGQKIDMLYLKERLVIDNETHYLCDCDCGRKDVLIKRTYFDDKKSIKSCGCYSSIVRKEMAKKKRRVLTGQKIGKLNIKNYIIKNQIVYYYCDCDCGRKDVLIPAGNILNGTCKSCGCINSIGETLCGIFFEDNNIKYEKPKKFSGLVGVSGGYLSYDFYLPDYNILIECQGIQHEKPIERFGGKEQFEIQQEHDKRKREYANKNGYRLIKIWYKDYKEENIESILKNILNIK